MSKYTHQPLTKLLFISALVFSSVFICHSDRLSGFFSSYGNSIIALFLKLLLSVVLSAGATILLMYKTNDYSFITKSLCTITGLTSILIIADTYVFHLYGSSFMYETIHTMYFLSAVFACFVTVTLYTAVHPNSRYRTFYKWLWISVTPILLFIFIRVFIRNPDSYQYYSVNLEPFYRINQMLDYVTHNFSVGMGQTYILIGNVLFFIPIGFLIPFYLHRLPGWAQLVSGLVLPILIELYQWIFRCGDVDVDDVILNYLGFFIGLLLCKLIEKKVLNHKQKTSHR